MNYMQIQQVSYSIVQEKALFWGVCAEILLFLGFVQKYYCPELLHHCYLVKGLFQGTCRNISLGEEYSPLMDTDVPEQVLEMLAYLKRMIKHKIRYTCQVRKEEGLYAFFMEAAAIEYHVERYCELKQLGGLLDSKGYGIALPKGFLYLNYTMAPSFPLGHQHIHHDHHHHHYPNHDQCQFHQTHRTQLQFPLESQLSKKEAPSSHSRSDGGKSCVEVIQ